MKGVPIRLEIGPKDIEKNQCVLVRRDTREKIFVSLDNLEAELERVFKEYADALYARAKENLVTRTVELEKLEDIIAQADKNDGFVKTHWCGSAECEQAMKDQAGMSSRCMPFGEQGVKKGVCPVCGKETDTIVVWGKAY